ncbi:hypothetical protein [Microbacterium sp. NPDC091676]|uniref:hypothetical protein n=1 Tax=Microbacterium sp. NPDC091676 TaxID=3364212 RepID=UPI0037FBC9EC
MTDERENPPSEQAVLPQAHRTIRLLGPAEGPLGGALVTSPDGPVVRLDAEGLRGWAGWRYAGAQHVAAPVDVVRRPRGHDVLLPWCTETLESFLDRAARTRGGLSSGEVSTVVASMLRGLSELGPTPAAEIRGVWWLTESGRPVFVLGSGQEAAPAVVAIVERLAAECADKALVRILVRVLERLRTAVAQRRVPRRLLEDGERELLEIAAPRPLEKTTDDHETASAAVGVGAALRRDRSEPPARTRSRERRAARDRPRAEERGAVAVRLRALRDHLADRVRTLRGSRGAATREQKDHRGTPPRRTRVFVVAGACAAAVFLAGSLWPSGGGGSAAGTPDRRSTATARPSTPDPADETSPEPMGSSAPSASAGAVPPRMDDPLAALPGVMRQIAECEAHEDPVCSSAMAAGSSGITAVVAELEGAEGALVDRYGDIAVVELSSSPTGPESAAASTMVVLVWADEKWLVRDAYRVADQPK